ncbi:phospholipase A1, partial [Rhizoctonia solani]
MIFASALTVTTFAAAALAGSIVPRATTTAPADVTDKIQLHARLAMAAYINPGGCESSISGSKVLQQFTSPAGQNGFIIQMNATKEVNIVFRGTLSLRNGQTNADSTPAPVSWPGCTGCTVHHGFYTNYLDAKNYTNGFATAFNAASALGYKVNCVGHSLGAAVAAMCAGDLYPSGKVSEIYTYGEFRTMNQAAATWVDSRLG